MADKQTDNSQKRGFWIHKQAEDKRSVSGYFVLPGVNAVSVGLQYRMKETNVRIAEQRWIRNGNSVKTYEWGTVAFYIYEAIKT